MKKMFKDGEGLGLHIIFFILGEPARLWGISRPYPFPYYDMTNRMFLQGQKLGRSA